ncbi:hypothetical protein ACH4HG_36325 [Streptomyces coeruleorubidus]|uniref:hypothetical protein n=1 Tax=Streptomyces coeruleorubidus TaxID=116188 RepID=UPI00379CC373
MDAKARTTGLAALSPDLPPTVEAFVTDLRTYFARLDVSVRAYAGRRHMDPGTVSRYLNGSRRTPWSFVTTLLADVAEHCGAPVTADAMAGLRRLHDAVSECRQPGADLQRLQDRFLEQDEEVRRLRLRERALLEAIDERQQQLARQSVEQSGLQAKFNEQRHTYTAALEVWRERCGTLMRAGSALRDEVADLRRQLEDTRVELRMAEERCHLLEEQLDAAEELLSEGVSGASLMEALEAADRTASVPELVQLVGGLATGPRGVIASELVTSVSRCRPVAEVQALLGALYGAGLHKHAEAALPAMVAMRPVGDMADLIGELLRAGLQEPAAALLQASVELHSPEGLAELARILHRRGHRDAVLVLLSATVAHRSVPEVLAVCGLLTDPSFGDALVQAVACPAQDRVCGELAELVIALHASGFGSLADALQSAMARSRVATDVAELIGALRRAGLSTAAADVFSQTQQRTTGHLVALVSALHTANLHDAASDVLSHALKMRPAAELAQLIIDLNVAGRHKDASDALTACVRSRTQADTRVLMHCLDQMHPGMDSLSLLAEAATLCSPEHAADMLIALLDGDLHEHANAIYTCTTQDRPTGHVSAALLRLHTTRPKYLTPTGLAVQARASTASSVVNLSLALHTARLDTHLDAVLEAAGPQQSAGHAAVLLKNFQRLHEPSKGQSTRVAMRLLDHVVRSQPLDYQLALIGMLDRTSLNEIADQLEGRMCSIWGTRRVELSLYAMQFTGKAVVLGPTQQLRWTARRTMNRLISSF